MMIFSLRVTTRKERKRKSKMKMARDLTSKARSPIIAFFFISFYSKKKLIIIQNSIKRQMGYYIFIFI